MVRLGKILAPALYQARYTTSLLPAQTHRPIPWEQVANSIPDLKSYRLHICFLKRILVNFPSQTFDGLIGPICASFSLISFVSFQTHWFALRGQTRVNNQNLFIMPPLTQLPMQYSDRLCYSYLLLILKHAQFLLRPIGMYPRNSCLSLKNSEPLL